MRVEYEWKVDLYGATILCKGADKLEASRDAARKAGIPWRECAGYMTFTRLGRAT